MHLHMQVSIPAYRAASFTDLSPGGEGAWFDIARINMPPKVDDDKSQNNKEENKKEGGGEAMSRQRTAGEGHEEAGSRAQTAQTAASKASSSPSQVAGRSTTSSSSQVPARSRGATAESRLRPGSEASRRPATSAAEDAAVQYSGQVCVTCNWIRFPQVWKVKTSSTADKHSDEVTGVAFSWKDWDGTSEGAAAERRAAGAAGAAAEGERGMILTSCALDGRLRCWQWAWNETVATDAEGQVMASIFDQHISIHEKGGSLHNKSSTSRPATASRDRPGTRPGTSEKLSRMSSGAQTPSKGARAESQKKDKKEKDGLAMRPGRKTGGIEVYGVWVWVWVWVCVCVNIHIRKKKTVGIERFIYIYIYIYISYTHTHRWSSSSQTGRQRRK